MLKKEIYPKTKRVGCLREKVYITEKIDGSNMVIFKKNDLLYVAQRKTIICEDEFEIAKDVMYKGLYQWLLDYKEELKSKLLNNACICGEWMGMGCIKYSSDTFDKKFYMFAKANIDIEFDLYNLIYDHNLFIYPFENQEIPSFIGIVPEVTELITIPTKEDLDAIYEKYCNKVNRKVEGFVINYKNTISKYVRMKNNKLVEHSDNDHKGIKN